MKHYDDIEADDSFDMGVEWIQLGNYDKALIYLNRAIELNPHFIYAYIALARVHATKKMFSESIQTLKRASRLDPGFDRIPYLMAKYAYKNGDYKQALQCIDRALAIVDTELYEQARSIMERGFRGRDR
ncbi:MAG: tetratricopeptide repeat protein [Spirochaetes bacterium]|nr:tetratricopeptide repeat protein [Spirochaetota bacterium]